MVIRKRPIENKFSESLEDRVQRLETRLKALEAEQGYDERTNALLHGDVIVDDDWLYGEMVQTSREPAAKRNVGKPAKITDEDFARRRDRMVGLFEGLWPEMESILSARYTTSKELKEALLSSLPGRVGDQPFQRILSNVKQLRSEARERSLIPRNLAYAMAGVPELTTRSSFDRCGPSRQPCVLPIHFNAMRDHICRRHPKWYALLTAELAHNVAPTQKTLKKVPAKCRECERFLVRPDRLIPALQLQERSN